MNDTLMPEWMKKKQEQVELENAKQEAIRQRDLAVASLIQLKSPDFWKRLKEQLGIAVEFLPKLGLQGQITDTFESVRVSMSRPGAYPNQTYTDLSLQPRSIHCTTLNGGAYELNFSTHSDTEICVVQSNTYTPPLNPEEAAKLILEKMMEIIRKQGG
jgi:hypothetical protein